MNLIIGIIISSIIGSSVFVILLMLRPFTGKIFSKSWHYYMLLVPLLLLLGGTHIGIGIAGLIPDPAVGSQAYLNFPQESHQYVRISAESHQYDDLSADGNQNSSAHYGATDDNSHLGMVMAGESVPYRNVFPLINGAFIIRGLSAFAPFLLGVWIVGVILHLGMNKVAYLKYRRVLLENSSMVTTIKGTFLDRCCSRKFLALTLEKTSLSPRNDFHSRTKIPVITTKYTDTPMLIGILKPMIVLPNLYLVDEELEMVLEHELTHYRRKDLIVKLAMLIANGIHWFNPLVYALSKQLNIMCELSCDEKVVLKMDNLERRFYGETILYVLGNSTGKKDLKYNVAFATNQNDSKERMRSRLMNVLQAKKMKKITVAIAIVAGMLIIGGSVFAANTLNGAIPVDEEIDASVASSPTIEMDDATDTSSTAEDMFPEPAYTNYESIREYIAAQVGNTFIQVDLTNQHLWYFVGGELVLESSVVTERPGIYATPTGVFEIL